VIPNPGEKAESDLSLAALLTFEAWFLSLNFSSASILSQTKMRGSKSIQGAAENQPKKRNFGLGCQLSFELLQICQVWTFTV
jgi:hypothetical protein